MSDKIDWNIHSRSQKSATSPGNAGKASALRGTKLDLLKVAWKSLKARLPGDFAAGRHPVAAFLRRHLALTVLLACLVFPVAAMLLGYITRLGPGTEGQAAAGLSASTADSGSGKKVAKPAPGKPLLAAAETPSPVVTHPVWPAAVEAAQPSAGMASLPPRPLNPAPTPVPNALPPRAPDATARPPYTPLVYTARHDKVLGGGCSGQLTLDSNGLVFNCAEDPRGSVQVALDEIEAVDGNGVRLISGRKYHFSIAGLARSNAEQLFANWLSRVR